MTPKLNEVFKKNLKEAPEGNKDLSPGAIKGLEAVADLAATMVDDGHDNDQALLADVRSLAYMVTALHKQLSDAIKSGRKMTTFQDPEGM